MYKFDAAAGSLAAHSETLVTIGGGARHLCIHPGGKVVYVNEESGARVTAYAWDAAVGRDEGLLAYSFPPFSFVRRIPTGAEHFSDE